MNLHSGFQLLCICFCSILLDSSQAAADPTTSEFLDSKVNHVYVVRRPLGSPTEWEPLTNRWKLVHSALILKTADKRFALLEYMEDGKTYLTEVSPRIVKEHVDDGYVVIRMKGQYVDPDRDGDGPIEFRWTRQLKGTKLAETHSLADLKKKMHELMAGKPYSLLKHNCHVAQEKLRKSIGLKVD
ncbi:MAG TPA: hypothetical protein DDW52_28025 [Planctomycetaceae bacterium]|nr:hypothetical protein [Planctomycetaceae bacterium]